MQTLVKDADWVLTFDEKGTRIPGGSLLYEGNKILAVGRNLHCEEKVNVLDARGKIVLPGLINTHHHFFQALTRNIAQTQDITLFPWLTILYEIWKGIDRETVGIGTAIATAELLKTGCTTSVDHHYVFPREHSAGLVDEQIQMADSMGLRFHPCRGSMSLGKDQGGLPPMELVQSDEDILYDSERLIYTYHDPDPFAMCRIVLAPCSPFSVTAELMRRTEKLARKHGVFLHTHLAETRDEEDYCLEVLGMRPLAYMESLGWLGEDVWFAHGIHFNDEEIAKMGETKTGVSHCPASNMRLNSGICRVKDLREVGARVGLAVDGSASNDASNMWGEVRLAYLLQKLALGTQGLTAEEVLWMATRGGATLLGRNDLGMLAPGMAADFILIDYQQLAFAGGQHDPAAALVNTGISHIVDTSVINGKMVVQKGQVLTFDEERVIHEANCLSTKLVSGVRGRLQ